jgi:hypothetical protein
MTEYVIKEVSLHQWLVFADRDCIAFCADEEEAVKAMNEDSLSGRRSLNSIAIEPGQIPLARTVGLARAELSQSELPKNNRVSV